uniref:LamG-like jellyroll fold domain-containing protein n=1 Tax=Amphimedon queenslandica TaxID=400682 RepID=A0A1X7UZX4_AMPQE
MKYTLFCIFFIIACTHAHDKVVLSSLVGHWTFEKGQELEDLTGNFGDIVLKGAVIQDGKLDVGAGKWAIAPSYTGPSISEKTLVSWVMIQNPNVQSGSALTIDKCTTDEFDAIVYGERQSHRWMSGSSNGIRTIDATPGYQETNTKVYNQIAITYRNNNGQAHVRLYHDGIKFGEYTKGPLGVWPRGDTEIFWGLRHGSTNGGPGNLDMLIEESRIYASVLTPNELQSLIL